MDIYVQAIVLTFIEALCCELFFGTFLKIKNTGTKWKNYIIFFILFIGFIGIASLSVDVYMIKALLSIIFICVIMNIKYDGRIINVLFLSCVYYGLVICIDRIMLTFVHYFLAPYEDSIFEDSIKTIVLALLCKIILFICIMVINRLFKPQNNFYLIPNNEWLRFICFPVITMVCMTAFALEGGTATTAVLISAFALVLSNFLIFYIIRDVVANEQRIQEMRVSRERLKNQMDMYQYMESVYDDQRKKTHDFKNHMGCVQGLLKAGDYIEAEEYLEKINQNWIKELDYINTNNAIVNSVINQKFKLAKSKNIPMVLSINNLKNLTMADEDIVTILSNLLDNAIEACEKLENMPREIKVQFTEENGKVTISVRNPVAEPLNISGGRLITTKKDKKLHGLGIANIENAVKKYGGECIYSYNEGFFTYSIVI